MKLQHIVYCFSAVLTTAVKAEQPSKTVTIPFVKTSIKRNSPLFEKRNSVLETLSNHQNVGYLVSIEVGTPPQSFDVILDTTSIDVWIPSSSCPSAQCPSARFDTNSSSTFKNLDKNFNVTHVSGNATGRYATDVISIGGTSITGQQFGLASSTTIKNTDNPYPVYMNGVLGLACLNLTSAHDFFTYYYDSFLLNMKRQNFIESLIFSIYLNSSSQNGEVTFGGIDDSKYQGSISYLPALHKYVKEIATEGYGYWMVYGDGFSATEPSIAEDGKTWSPRGFAYVFDTSSMFSYMPSDAVYQTVVSMTGAPPLSVDTESGAYIVDCSVDSSAALHLKMVDDVVNTTSNINLQIPLTQLLIPTGETQNGTNLCLFGIAPKTIDSTPYFIEIGDSILRSFYTVFDMEEKRIGFASSVGAASKVTSNGSKSSKFSNSYIFATTCLIVAFLWPFV